MMGLKTEGLKQICVING